MLAWFKNPEKSSFSSFREIHSNLRAQLTFSLPILLIHFSGWISPAHVTILSSRNVLLELSFWLLPVFGMCLVRCLWFGGFDEIPVAFIDRLMWRCVRVVIAASLDKLKYGLTGYFAAKCLFCCRLLDLSQLKVSGQASVAKLKKKQIIISHSDWSIFTINESHPFSIGQNARSSWWSGRSGYYATALHINAYANA